MANRISITRKQTGPTWEHVIMDCEMVVARIHGKTDEAAQAVADALFPKQASAPMRKLADASDADIEAWLERHDLASSLRGSEARAAFEDAQTWHLAAEMPDA